MIEATRGYGVIILVHGTSEDLSRRMCKNRLLMGLNPLHAFSQECDRLEKIPRWHCYLLVD